MIHVCYGLRDESGKYSKFAGVSMQSILDNTQEKVTIHILHDSTLSEENYRKLALIALNHNQEIKFYNVETLAPDAIEFVQKNLPKINNFWGTIGALYRTLIPRFLDAERAIYLDTDVLVNLDIKDFWEVDLQSKPLGAVPECFSGDTHVTRIFGLCQNGTVDPHDYFNSGVLLMDLDRIRGGGGNLFENCIKTLAENPSYRFMDQDALNFLFVNNFLKLPVKFNHIRAWMLEEKVEREIYHYCGVGKKPYPDFSNPFNVLWFEYFVKTPFCTIQSFGNLWNAFEVSLKDKKGHVMNRINFLKRIFKLSATHLRAFYTAPENLEKIRDWFGDDPRDLFFDSTNPESLQMLIQDVKKYPGKRVYYLLVDTETYWELHKNLLNRGSDFFDIRQLFEPLIANKYNLFGYDKISKSI